MHGIDQDQTRDVTLMASVANGDTQALGMLYDRHASRLLGIAIAILSSRREAEDLLHDVFMELWQKARHYDTARGTVAYWLLLRTRSRAIDRQRRLRKKQEMEQRAGQEAAVLSSDVPPPEHFPITEYLDALPPLQREAVVLSYLQGYTCSEIAKLIGAPVPTIKSRLQSALKKMREHYALALEGAS